MYRVVVFIMFTIYGHTIIKRQFLILIYRYKCMFFINVVIDKKHKNKKGIVCVNNKHCVSISSLVYMVCAQTYAFQFFAQLRILKLQDSVYKN